MPLIIRGHIVYPPAKPKLPVKVKRERMPSKYRNWTEAEIDLLKASYRKTGAGPLVEIFDRTATSIKHKAAELGLTGR